MRLPPTLLVLLLVSAVPQALQARQETDPVPSDRTQREGLAIERIGAGDYEAARRILAGLLVDRYIKEANRAFAAGSPEDALLVVDRALALAPRDPSALRAKAEGSLALAQKTIAAGGSGLLIQGALEDALQSYRTWSAVADSVVARMGASHAAWLLGDPGNALEQARAGMALLKANPEQREGLETLPERTYAEAAFGAYTRAKAEESADAEARFDEARDALGQLLGFAPDDPWVWGTQGELYEWAQDYGEALRVLTDGLARHPEDDGLLQRFTRVARKSGGFRESVAQLERIVKREPDAALGRWYLARERFEFAAEGIGNDEREADAALFRLAEQEFVRCRKLNPEYDEACKGYEIVCRSGTGWCHIENGELEAATKSFLSMNDIYDRGITWEMSGRMLSGVMGLAFVADRYNQDENWAKAADLFWLASEFEPEESLWANNAGFFYRDAGVELEFLARDLCRAARGQVGNAEALAELEAHAQVPADANDEARARAFAQASNVTVQEARRLMEKSGVAYLRASELTPEDVRVVNDTALVFVYYLHTNLELSKELLLRCVETGRRQLAAGDLDEDATWELENAWGDAHQNLGVYFANHANQPEEALRWFARAAEIGPEPRPVITNFWLPYLRGEREDGGGVEIESIRTWGEACVVPPRAHK